jgi:diaminohydroxyphosphoribosylaminopyrimidine deaminase / 5-amino-6-(5-phosphoribosylamino)uracil reductase
MKVVDALDALSCEEPPAAGVHLTPDQAMTLAVQTAWQGLGHVNPNPMVGCVLVDANHRYVASGAHLNYGESHAEINLIQNLQSLGRLNALKDGILYLSLEPCSHHGKTPPCADALVKYGAQKIRIANQDPNPTVNGNGIRKLEAAGIEVQIVPGFEELFSRQNQIFLHLQKKRVPVFVGLKAAASVDGTIAKQGDQRAWITGARARAYGHFLRMYYDAIAVGQNTLLLDNPTLDPVDYQHARLRTPWKVLIDPSLKALSQKPLEQWNILRSDPKRVIIITDQPIKQTAELQDALSQIGCNLIHPTFSEAGVCTANAILDALVDRGITSLLLEGGAGLYGPFLDANLVNRLHLFQAPLMLGRLNAIHLEDGRRNSDARTLKQPTLSILGEDWLIEAELSAADL